MNKIAKFLVLLLLAIPIIAFATGSGEQKAAGASIAIKHLTWLESEFGPQFYPSVIGAFQKRNPNIAVGLEAYPYPEYYNKLLLESKAGLLPDVLQVQTQWVPALTAAGILEDLGPYFAKERSGFKDEFLGLDGPTWNGKTWLLSMSVNTYGWYYNKDTFNNAGLTPPDSWPEEFVQVAQKLTDPATGKYAWMVDLSMSPANGVYYYFVQLLYTAGGEFVDRTTWKCRFNSSAGVKALEFIKDLDQKYKVLYPGTLQNSERERRETFGNGSVAQMVDGSWGIPMLAQINPKLNFGVTLLPKNVNRNVMALTYLAGVSAQSKNKQAAWQFVKFMCDDKEGNLLWCQGSKNIPSKKEYMNAPWISEDVHLAEFTRVARDSVPVFDKSVIPNGAENTKVLMAQIHEFMLGNKTAKQALDEAAKAIDQDFDKYFKR